jgi:hypothetical protein
MLNGTVAACNKNFSCVLSFYQPKLFAPLILLICHAVYTGDAQGNVFQPVQKISTAIVVDNYYRN